MKNTATKITNTIAIDLSNLSFEILSAGGGGGGGGFVFGICAVADGGRTMMKRTRSRRKR
jgi:hypothetical protein